jgi:hypothetical protein
MDGSHIPTQISYASETEESTFALPPGSSSELDFTIVSTGELVSARISLDGLLWIRFLIPITANATIPPMRIKPKIPRKNENGE